MTQSAGRPSTDWIALYKVGDPNSAYGWWAYTQGAASGSFNLTAPATAGSYELRYLQNNGFTSVATSNAVTVTAASSTGQLPAPTNLSVLGRWDTTANAPTDVLGWTPVAGAVSYNIYRYDVLLVEGLTSTQYTVPTSRFAWDQTYAVTAVDASGQASLSLTNLAVASHTITAAYGGDACHDASVSPALSQVVNAVSSAVAPALTNDSFDRWVNSVDSVFLNPIPVRWDGNSRNDNAVDAEQASPGANF